MIFCILAIASLVGTFGHAATFNANVTRVIDGDTIQVMDDLGEKKTIRLFGIDAPELSQRDGPASGRYLSVRIGHEPVVIVSHGEDKYGRTLGDIYTANGRYINKEMVQFGLAWVYRRDLKDKSWLKLERMAKKNRIGLWRRKSPRPPWQYRHKNRRS